MPRILAERFYRSHVKALNIQNGAEQAFLHHAHQILCDPAHTETAPDMAADHRLPHIVCHCQGNSTRSGLKGETVLQIPRVNDYLRRKPGNFEAHRISGDPGRP